MSTLESTDRSTVRRLPERGTHDLEIIHQILDEALICHVGFVADGQPFVIPTIHARVGETLYFHGSPASRMLRSLRNGIDTCVTVTLVDGLVIARSAFHHSLNYRSVVVLGKARAVTDDAEKKRALDAVVEHVVPGRTTDARGPNEQELRKTLVLALDLVEATAKIRTGPPVDDEEDYALPIWAGVVPLRLEAGSPINDLRLMAGIEVPNYLKSK